MLSSSLGFAFFLVPVLWAYDFEVPVVVVRAIALNFHLSWCPKIRSILIFRCVWVVFSLFYFLFLFVVVVIRLSTLPFRFYCSKFQLVIIEKSTVLTELLIKFLSLSHPKCIIIHVESSILLASMKEYQQISRTQQKCCNGLSSWHSRQYEDFLFKYKMQAPSSIYTDRGRNACKPILKGLERVVATTRYTEFDLKKETIVSRYLCGPSWICWTKMLAQMLWQRQYIRYSV